MKKCVIFGCGQTGTDAFGKLNKCYSVIAWSDNNPDVWDSRKNGLPIFSPTVLKERFDLKNDIVVIVAALAYREIATQLAAMGIRNIIIWMYGFLYSWHGYLAPDLEWQDVTLSRSGDVSKISHADDKLRVLFVQPIPCIRTHKIAKAMKKLGHHVYLLYTVTPPEYYNKEYTEAYDDIYTVFSINAFLKFASSEKFDIIHSSNEPDFLTLLLTRIKKTVIHDCHDLSSAYKPMTIEEMVTEWVSNTDSHGTIYPTEELRAIAIENFSIPPDRSFVLENLISEELKPICRKEKLSRQDHSLHCVYEGGVVRNIDYRNFDNIWTQIANYGIHVHFYTQGEENYCRFLESLNPEYIHYEGNLSSRELANEMSQYDVGLCLFNVTEKNRAYLEASSPNKIQEYINAGIPVVVGDIERQRRFVEDNGFGKRLDLNGDIQGQLREIAKMQIPENVLRDKCYTLESNIPKLIEFYKHCMKATGA